MATPVQFLLKYSGSQSMVAGTPYNGADFSLGNVMQMKTVNVRVSIGGMDGFLISFDDIAYVDTTTTYTFDQNCTIAFGTAIEVT